MNVPVLHMVACMVQKIGDVYHRVKIIDIQFEKRVTHKNHRVTLAASAKHTAGFKYGVEHIVWH